MLTLVLGTRKVLDIHGLQAKSLLSDSLRPYGLGPPGSSVPGILQERILEWVAMPSSREIFLTQG